MRFGDVKREGSKVVVGSSIQQRIIRERAGRHEADDFSADYAFRLGGVFGLFADGDLAAGVQQVRRGGGLEPSSPASPGAIAVAAIVGGCAPGRVASWLRRKMLSAWS